MHEKNSLIFAGKVFLMHLNFLVFSFFILLLRVMPLIRIIKALGGSQPKARAARGKRAFLLENIAQVRHRRTLKRRHFFPRVLSLPEAKKLGTARQAVS